MSANKIVVEQQIKATPSAVWNVLTNLEEAKALLPGVTGIEHLAGPAYGVGTRWRETRKMFGTEASEVMEVVAVDPERSTELIAESHGMRYTTGFEITPTATGCSLTMRFCGEQQRANFAQRLIGAITAPLGRAVTKRAMRQDLAAIAIAAESASA